ncbi:MAG: ADP-ribosylglycohydrolase family protein [Pseudonocardiales bacterium]|nr:MAG: ADP-ribosylglycohydrolase family protein [Pseudonocardiales bacterium]
MSAAASSLTRGEPTARERIRGCLLGGAIGDALGAGIEFASLQLIRATYGQHGVTDFAPAYGRANAITDDTQLTLFTVDALLEHDDAGRDLPARLWRSYLAWASYQHGRPPRPSVASSPLTNHPAMTAVRAPGNSCLSGLAQASMGTLTNPANPASKGCGAVMRSAPFGLAAATAEQAWQQAIAGAVLTHGHPSGYLSAAALAWIVWQLLHGAPLPTAVESVLERLRADGAPAGECVTALSQAVALAGADTATPESVQRLGGGWVGEEALAIGVYAALTRPDDPDAALLLSVNHSGDSDSTGSICGNLLGTAHGEQALPARWTSTVEAADLVLGQAERLAARYLDGAQRSPNDATGMTRRFPVFRSGIR